MKTYILVKDDVRSRASGYHLNVWGDIMDSFGLPADTEQVEIRPALNPGRTFVEGANNHILCKDDCADCQERHHTCED